MTVGYGFTFFIVIERWKLTRKNVFSENNGLKFFRIFKMFKLFLKIIIKTPHNVFSNIKI